jgi:uncharacterized protein YecT (DUF1311 family)
VHFAYAATLTTLASTAELLAEAQRYELTMTATMLCEGTRARVADARRRGAYRKLLAETHERWKRACDHYAPTELYGSEL